MKDDPYPFRLDKDEAEIVHRLVEITMLNKATILRLAVRAGLDAIDWKKYAPRPINSVGVVSTLRSIAGKQVAGSDSSTQAVQRIRSVGRTSAPARLKAPKHPSGKAHSPAP